MPVMASVGLFILVGNLSEGGGSDVTIKVVGGGSAAAGGGVDGGGGGTGGSAGGVDISHGSGGVCAARGPVNRSAAAAKARPGFRTMATLPRTGRAVHARCPSWRCLHGSGGRL